MRAIARDNPAAARVQFRPQMPMYILDMAPLFQIDAFTSEAFRGNPAAVCLLDSPREEGWMQKVAAEMREQAQKEAQDRLAKAEDEIMREREKQKELLKEQVVMLSIKTAEKILAAKLDDPAQRQLASKFIDEDVVRGFIEQPGSGQKQDTLFDFESEVRDDGSTVLVARPQLSLVNGGGVE